MKNSSTTTDADLRDLLLWMRKEGIGAHSIQVGDVTITGLSGIVRDKDGKAKEPRQTSMLEQLAGPLAGDLGLEVEVQPGVREVLEPIEEDEDE